MPLSEILTAAHGGTQSDRRMLVWAFAERRLERVGR